MGPRTSLAISRQLAMRRKSVSQRISACPRTASPVLHRPPIAAAYLDDKMLAPLGVVPLADLTWARFLLGDYEAAAEDARRAIQRPAATFLPHTILASALALLDRREEAKIVLKRLLEIKSDFTLDTTLTALSPINPEAVRPLLKMWIDGLRKAGLDIPDEPSAAK